MNAGKKRFLGVLIGVCLTAAACSGGGGGGEDPTEGALENGERLVSFAGTGGLKLAGTMGVPDNLNGSAPAVLILPTIGVNVDRDGFQNETIPDLMYEDLSDAFRAAGMVTLRYDRRGLAASKLESGQKKPTYEQMVGDAAGALKFLAKRSEVGNQPIGVVGHDVSGWAAMQLAATESRVKSLSLISVPGRPMVDIMADGFKATYGQASADKFRAEVAVLLSTGALPPPDAIAPQHQNVLSQGAADMLKGVYAANPLADAPKVKVPTQVTYGTLSTTVGKLDADLIAQAIGAPAKVVAFNLGATLRMPQPDTASIPFNPADESTHLFGARPVVKVPRDTAAVGDVTNYFVTNLKAAKG